VRQPSGSRSAAGFAWVGGLLRGLGEGGYGVDLRDGKPGRGDG